MIDSNLELVLKNIEKAALKSGRKAEDITLIAVSKTKPFEDIVKAYDCGMRNFGENKTNEIREKFELARDLDIDFHMIGHLQRNKVKYIVDKVVLIHSVDSLRLAKKIDEEAKKKEVIVDVLLQINIGQEDSKFGTNIAEVEDLVQSISSFSSLRLRGLMCIAPYVVDPEENRQLFRKMKDVFVDIKAKNKDNNYIDILSMGMSNDYEVAIEEGSTMVRVGTAIFGERNYNRA